MGYSPTDCLQSPLWIAVALSTVCHLGGWWWGAPVTTPSIDIASREATAIHLAFSQAQKKSSPTLTPTPAPAPVPATDPVSEPVEAPAEPETIAASHPTATAPLPQPTEHRARPKHHPPPAPKPVHQEVKPEHSRQEPSTPEPKVDLQKADAASEQLATTVVKEVRLRQQPQPPTYPRMALKRRWQGEVLLQALVDLEGTTQDIKVVRSSGYPLLDQAAMEAVSNWEFEPSNINGHLVTSWVEVPIDFTIRR